ncbi:hypothetical protein MMC07_003637 [Pseudocyphellaria aurata]|nr:hypothetical protein [Pseudocyphellaria aurata]
MKQGKSNPELDDEKDSETGDSDHAQIPLLDASLPYLQKQSRFHGRGGTYLLIANSILFCLSLILLITTTSRTSPVPQDYCIKKLSFYSPVLDLLSDDYQTVTFVGHSKEGSPYQGPPNARVDAAWDRLTKVGPFSLDPMLLKKIKAPEYAVKFPEISGGGYMAILESIHQVHCVNVLWQNIYPDYYRNRSEYMMKPHDEAVEHLDHCADMLRQKIMCDADVGVITYNWHENNSGPVANFNTPHKCRNFDRVLDWSYEHQGRTPDGLVHRPDDAINAPTP